MNPATSPDAVRVVAAVIIDSGRLLISKRRRDARRGGLWELPGGKVESKESDSEALVRELQEELGIEAAVGDRFDRVVHAYPDLLIELVVYRCRIVTGAPRPLHSDAIEWAPLDCLAEYEFPAADAPLIERLLKEAG